MKQFKENSTFKSGKDGHLNACVGTNGFVDIETYEDGYDLAVKLLAKASFDDFGIVDPIIYPLVFSARHRIELFLKNSISCLEIINKATKRKIQSLKYLTTHDIKVLWEYLKKLSFVDCRYSDIVNRLNPFIEDYYIVDLTGETFRYPYDTEDTHHLDDFSCINIRIFIEQYTVAAVLIEKVEYLNKFLLEEYRVGTFVCGMSREQIEEISKQLPNIAKWKERSFDKIKNKICRKYSLSSTAFSKVVNKIRGHREFVVNIGASLPVAEISIEEYQIFRQNIIELHALRTKHQLFELKNRFANEIISKLSTTAICAIIAFEEIGRFLRYSEDYDPLHAKYMGEDPRLNLFTRLMDNIQVLKWIEKGMKICGQLHLISS